MKQVMTIAIAGCLPCGAPAPDISLLVASFVRACVKRGADAVLFPASVYDKSASETAKQAGIYLIFGTCGVNAKIDAVCTPDGTAMAESDRACLERIASDWAQDSPETLFFTATLCGKETKK